MQRMRKGLSPSVALQGKSQYTPTKCMRKGLRAVVVVCLICASTLLVACSGYYDSRVEQGDKSIEFALVVDSIDASNGIDRYTFVTDATSLMGAIRTWSNIYNMQIGVTGALVERMGVLVGDLSSHTYISMWASTSDKYLVNTGVFVDIGDMRYYYNRLGAATMLVQKGVSYMFRIDKF